MRILYSLLLISCGAHALQDGDLDTSFGVNGFRYLDTVPVGGVPTNERGQFAARLPDGRLLVVLQGQQSGAQRAFGSSAQPAWRRARNWASISAKV